MPMILIRKKYKLEQCPFCKGGDFKDVSNVEYSNMFECIDCGKITQVKFDLESEDNE